MFSIGSVALSDPDGTDIQAWIDENIRPEKLFPLAYRTWPDGVTNGPILDITPEVPRPVTIGTLWWPWGASRFARAHFVVSESQLAQVRQLVQASSGSSQAVPLTLTDGTVGVKIKMWMLPAWPLLTGTPGLGAYLITLVDDRYWWWEIPLNLTMTAGTTAWTDLYTSIGNAIGTAIAVDPIPGAYGTPTIDYASAYRPLPAVLDAVAWSVGQRIVRDAVSGAIKAQNNTTALASVNAQLSTAVNLYTGGKLALVAGQ